MNRNAPQVDHLPGVLDSINISYRGLRRLRDYNDVIRGNNLYPL